MFAVLIPSLFLYTFGFFNLLGIKRGLILNYVVFFVISLAIMFLVRKVGVQFFRLNSYFFYWLFIGLIVLTYIVGLEAKGSQRWINLYFFNFQASEFFKVFFILFFAEMFATKKRIMHDLSFFLLNVFYFLLPTLLIFKQPDLGSAMVYVFVFFTMIFFSGVPRKYLLYAAALALVFLPAGWYLLHDYQRARILSFFNPHIDRSGDSYNMTQAIITIGSGNFLGHGLGLGTQSRLSFLPENHTDFAFSSLVEQFGFIGGLAVIILYGVMSFIFIKRIIKFFYRTDPDGKFKFLYTLGFFSFMIFQVFVNMGMNLGVLPIAGITLPLISYGGSSLITWMIGLAFMP